jgi:hypothetical protein
MSETHISARQGSLGGATSDQRKSIQMMRLSNESMNISSRQSSQNSSMDATFLDRLHINTPTLENVGNTSRQENMFGIFFFDFVFLCIYVYVLYICVCVCVCVCVCLILLS